VKPEKMSSEDLDFELSQALSASRAEKVRAHIAAVEAERDALARFKAYVHERMDAAGVATHPDGEHSKAGCRIGDRFDALLAERDALRALVCPTPSTVQGPHKLGTNSASVVFAPGACEGPPCEREARTVGQHRIGCPAGSLVGHIVVPESFERDTSPTRADSEALCCKGPDGPGEPTTAEAFATVREEVDALTSAANMPETFRKVVGLLSLLERRMGAMGRALALVREAHYPPSDDHDTSGCRCVQCTVRDALTDAPPVFTREEVERAVRQHTGDSLDLAEAVTETLTAMRR
jgi:hypothetical protein